MAGFLDNAEIDIPCPNCGKKIKQKLGGLKNQTTVRCPSCGSLSKLEAGGKQGATQAIKQAEKRMADFQRALGKLGK